MDKVLIFAAGFAIGEISVLLVLAFFLWSIRELERLKGAVIWQSLEGCRRLKNSMV